MLGSLAHRRSLSAAAPSLGSETPQPPHSLAAGGPARAAVSTALHRARRRLSSSVAVLPSVVLPFSRTWVRWHAATALCTVWCCMYGPLHVALGDASPLSHPVAAALHEMCWCLMALDLLFGPRAAFRRGADFVSDAVQLRATYAQTWLPLDACVVAAAGLRQCARLWLVLGPSSSWAVWCCGDMLMLVPTVRILKLMRLVG